MKIVLVTGGFDPLHSGHIEYFKSAKELGDFLIVGVNSDAWLTRKKGRFFMPIEERSAIIRALSMVDAVVSFEGDYDEDNSCKKFVADTCANYSEHEIIFANGGDRSASNIQEMEVKAPNLSFAFGVGGEDKKNSSSWILKEWKNPTVTRNWGKYTVLDKNGTWAVKELSIDVGQSLSDQRHFKRSEHWHVVSGELQMDLEFGNGYKTSKVYKKGESIDIPTLAWHKATNVGKVETKVIEVWQGSELLEEDIERRS
jgi:D-beta-D-heptose 7-phosphate kinase/D-beta-D-heptose 1-phosphate adenosyltransferase